MNYFFKRIPNINDKFINSLPENFFPSLFQKKIDKKFEIRSFFIDNSFFSMAIFSQSNPKTKIDFRRYDHENPNRYVPFKLPKGIENKLFHVMNKLKINSGSIDLIYSNNKEIYFLEVNPIGQFGMISFPCNYYLEKIIAQKLSNKTLYGEN